MIRARVNEASLRAVTSGKQAWRAQLKITQQLANELDATLVRRRDGTYYLRAGSIHGVLPIGEVSWPEQYNPEEVEASTHAWLAKLADALEAELLYDGRQMEWYLRWPNTQETEEELPHARSWPVPADASGL